MRCKCLRVVLTAIALTLAVASGGMAFLAPSDPTLPNIDTRLSGLQTQAALGPDDQEATNRLKGRVRNVQIHVDRITGRPASMYSTEQLLTGADGEGKAVPRERAAGIPRSDKDRPVKAFLKEYRNLFGHGPEALEQARVRWDFTAFENRLRKVVWVQELDGIEVFGGSLIASMTTGGELASIHSRFLSNPGNAASAMVANRQHVQKHPKVSVTQALSLAAESLGMQIPEQSFVPTGEPGCDEMSQTFAVASLDRPVSAKLVWLPLNANAMTLCWHIGMVRENGDLYRLLVDVQTGEVRIRHCLTHYLARKPAVYGIFDTSPAPLSPTWSTPSTALPPVKGKQIRSLINIDPIASPNGWLPDDPDWSTGEPMDNIFLYSNNLPAYWYYNIWLLGDPYRVFDFPVVFNAYGDLSNATDYWQAGVTNAFYWGNFMHDVTYRYGFTENAGNYQNNQFGRNWKEDPYSRGDAAQIITRHPDCLNNARARYFDEYSYCWLIPRRDGRIVEVEMGMFNDGSIWRDSAMDADVIIHEYTHLMSNRLVNSGGGMIWWSESGLAEGWSDFFALALTRHPYYTALNGDYNGCFAIGPYVSATFRNTVGKEYPYYFGARRFPYSTDMSKNPLTVADIDPSQYSIPSGVPMAPNDSWPDEPHNAGEVWCSILWDARCNLVKKLGVTGNDVVLHLATTGMMLTSFSEQDTTWMKARDAMLLADTVLYGGAHHNELWEAFAKRGLGHNSYMAYWCDMCEHYRWCTFDIQESYNVPTTANQVAFPEFSVPGGCYTGPRTLGITCATDYATIRCTTDGSDPDETSPIYSQPFDITTNMIVKARAYKAGMTPSDIKMATYSVQSDLHAAKVSYPDGTDVDFEHMVVTACLPNPDQTGQYWVYVENLDRISGIRVNTSSSHTVGDTIDITGTIETDNTRGERYIAATQTALNTSSAFTVEPIGMRGEWVGGGSQGLLPIIREGSGITTVGMLVQTWGVVWWRGTDYFYVDDGSGLWDGAWIENNTWQGQWASGIYVKLPTGVTPPPLGSTVKVTGVCGARKLHSDYAKRMIYARAQNDIEEITTWNTTAGTLTPGGWNMLTMPGVLKGWPYAESVFHACSGPPIVCDGNLKRWCPLNQQWAFFSGCEVLFNACLVSEGYALYVPSGGATSYCYDWAPVTSDQLISLPKGSFKPDFCSFIGNPFTTDIEWNDISVTDAGSKMPLVEAMKLGWIHKIESWDGANWQTLSANQIATGYMLSKKGYRVYPNRDNMALLLPKP